MAATELYAVFLGGDLAHGRMGEDHEVVFIAGTDMREVRKRAREKWKGAGRAHVDAVMRISRVDGYEVILSHVGGEDLTDLDPTYEPD